MKQSPELAWSFALYWLEFWHVRATTCTRRFEKLAAFWRGNLKWELQYMGPKWGPAVHGNYHMAGRKSKSHLSSDNQQGPAVGMQRSPSS